MPSKAKQAEITARDGAQPSQGQSAEVEPAGAAQPADVRDPQRLRAKALKLHRDGRLKEAIGLYSNYLILRPKDAGIWSNLGVALRKTERFEASLACQRRSVELEPNSAANWGNLGNILKDLDHLEESLAAHETALKLRPNDKGILFNYGIALRETTRFADALEQFDICLEADPDSHKIQWERALVLLHLGRMEEGWRAYQSRLHIGELPRSRFKDSSWRGEDFRGERLILYPEQGFGDTILATRFLPLAKARGGEVILACKPPLRRLFSNLEGVDRLVEPDESETGYDHHCSMMDLPGIFETRFDDLPPQPRLTVPAAARDKARRLLDLSGDRFKVGIVWSGSTTFKNNRKRSVAPERFLALSSIPGLQLYSLQKGPLERQLTELAAGPVVIEVAKQIEDFADTAAVIEQLDLVIMTDSSVAHLAGSMGKPIWNLLCYMAYWLYGESGESTPWYPSMRLIRQPAPTDWDSVFARVHEDLEKAVAAKRDGRWPEAFKPAGPPS